MLQNQVFLPIPEKFEREMVPIDRTLKFTIRHQILGVGNEVDWERSQNIQRVPGIELAAQRVEIHVGGRPQTSQRLINRPEMKQIWLETSGHEIHRFLGRLGHPFNLGAEGTHKYA